MTSKPSFDELYQICGLISRCLSPVTMAQVPSVLPYAALYISPINGYRSIALIETQAIKKEDDEVFNFLWKGQIENHYLHYVFETTVITAHLTALDLTYEDNFEIIYINDFTYGLLKELIFNGWG